MNHLLAFGMGFSAKALARRLAGKGWEITGTSQSAAGAEGVTALGYRGLVFDGNKPLSERAFEGVSHILVSVPPDAESDPVFRLHANALVACASQIQWLGYLSTTGVYGDQQGGWVTEDSPLSPSTERGARRLAAEKAWLELQSKNQLPVHIFRLAGIYGPGRNALVSLLDGSAKRIVKTGQVFSRIHVEDIASVLEASIARPNPGSAYNVCDDMPCPPQDVIVHAARILGVEPPPEVPFESAELTAMARSFYAESKRVSNDRIKKELGISLEFPSYREGLAGLVKDLKR